MSTKFVTIPKKIRVLDAITGEQVKDPKGGDLWATFAQVFRGVCLMDVTRAAFDGREGRPDLFDLGDVRAGISSAEEGDVVEVDEPVHRALVPLIRAGTNMTPAFIFSPGAKEMLLAFIDAPSVDPRAKAAE